MLSHHPKDNMKTESAAIGKYCRRCIFACCSYYDFFLHPAKNKALDHSAQNLPPKPLSQLPWSPTRHRGHNRKKSNRPRMVHERKCSIKFISLTPILADEKFNRGHIPHRSRWLSGRLCFLCYFLCTSKESNSIRQAKERR